MNICSCSTVTFYAIFSFSLVFLHRLHQPTILHLKRQQFFYLKFSFWITDKLALLYCNSNNLNYYSTILCCIMWTENCCTDFLYDLQINVQYDKFARCVCRVLQEVCGMSKLAYFIIPLPINFNTHQFLIRPLYLRKIYFLWALFSSLKIVNNRWRLDLENTVDVKEIPILVHQMCSWSIGICEVRAFLLDFIIQAVHKGYPNQLNPTQIKPLKST